MENTIEFLRAAINSKLDDLAATLGESTPLNMSDKTDVSYEIDEINESWNDTLGPRPH